MLPVGCVGFQRPITEQLRFSAAVLWVHLSGLTQSPQLFRPRPQTEHEAVVGALGTQAVEVTGLVGFNGTVGFVVQVGGQRVLLLRLHVVPAFTYKRSGESV